MPIGDLQDNKQAEEKSLGTEGWLRYRRKEESMNTPKMGPGPRKLSLA